MPDFGVTAPLEPCVGCGALVAMYDGPTHAYIGASPGCWQRYGEVLAKEYGEYWNPAVHRLTVDAYAAQHPGVPGRRESQSVAVHLVTLRAILDRGFTPTQATQVLEQVLAQPADFPWLPPPADRGALTVLEVHAASHLDEHSERVEQWARSVWNAWSMHRQAVVAWFQMLTPAMR